MRTPTRLKHGEGWQDAGSERSEHRARIAGVWVRTCTQRRPAATRETQHGGRSKFPTSNPRGTGWAVRGGGEARTSEEAGQCRRSKGASVQEQWPKKEKPGDWHEPNNSRECLEPSAVITGQSEGKSDAAFLQPLRQDLPQGRAAPRLATLPSQRWQRRSGRADLRANRGARFGSVAG